MLMCCADSEDASVAYNLPIPPKLAASLRCVRQSRLLVASVSERRQVYYPAIIGLSTGGDLVLTATFVILLYRSRSSFKRWVPS